MIKSILLALEDEKKLKLARALIEELDRNNQKSKILNKKGILLSNEAKEEIKKIKLLLSNY